MHVSDYAKHRGVSVTAVRKAIQSGRLKKCLTFVNKKPKIANLLVADTEWTSNSVNDALGDRLDKLEQLGIPQVYVSAARAAHAKAERAELELGELQGRLVDADLVRAKYIDAVTHAKTRLLGLAARIKQHVAKLDADDVRAIDALVREALEGLADGDDD